MLPFEVEMSSHRRIAYAFNPNQELSKESLDLINELRDETTMRTVEYQQRMSRCYNSKVKGRSFQKGDLVFEKPWQTPKIQWMDHLDQTEKDPLLSTK